MEKVVFLVSKIHQEPLELKVYEILQAIGHHFVDDLINFWCNLGYTTYRNNRTLPRYLNTFVFINFDIHI